MLTTLPNEIIIKILQYLPFSDLCSLSLVSKTVHSLATDPLLWSNYKLHYQTPGHLINILTLHRFYKLKLLHLSNSELGDCNSVSDIYFSKQEIETVLDILTDVDLSDLRLSWINIKDIDKHKISEVVTNTEMVSIEAETVIDREAIEEILKKIPEGKLNCFQTNQVNFDQIDPELLSASINSLESFAAELCFFSQDQVKMIFQQMSVKTKLKDISLFFTFRNILANVPALTLGAAFNNLQNVYLGRGLLTSEQLFAIFHKMSSQTNLQRLFLTMTDTSPSLLQPIPTNILSQAINKLQVFIAPRLFFSTQQMKIILEQCAEDSSHLTRLDLGFREPLPELTLDTMRSILFKLENNMFKYHIQTKVIMNEIMIPSYIRGSSTF